jgi:hypothetical protein
VKKNKETVYFNGGGPVKYFGKLERINTPSIYANPNKEPNRNIVQGGA